MEVHILGSQNSLINQYISEIRCKDIQQDSMRFRRNVERIGEIMAYEISKTLKWKNVDITTPLGVANVAVMERQPILATILRAGLMMHQGLLNAFDKAGNAFISAYRKHHDNGEFEIKIEYLSSPDLDNRVLILSDPMVATGSSMVLAYQALLEQKGKPEHTHVVSLIASKQGLEYVKKHFPDNTTFWIAALDDELNSKSYIIPGLGDAGDLAYGAK